MIHRRFQASSNAMKFAVIVFVLAVACLWEAQGASTAKKALVAMKKTAAKAVKDVRSAKHQLHHVFLNAPPIPSAPKIFARLAAAQKELLKVKLQSSKSAKAASHQKFFEASHLAKKSG